MFGAGLLAICAAGAPAAAPQADAYADAGFLAARGDDFSEIVVRPRAAVLIGNPGFDRLELSCSTVDENFQHVGLWIGDEPSSSAYELPERLFGDGFEVAD